MELLIILRNYNFLSVSFENRKGANGYYPIFLNWYFFSYVICWLKGGDGKIYWGFCTYKENTRSPLKIIAPWGAKILFLFLKSLKSNRWNPYLNYQLMLKVVMSNGTF